MPPESPTAPVLLVDDKPQNLMALEAILSNLRLDVVKAGSGEEALGYLLKDDFAVILLDVRMPVMDGLQTAELIRGRERSRDTPIIFVTASGSDEDLVTRSYSLGAVDYIVKPIHPHILRSKVAVFVELFRKTAQLREQAAQLAGLNEDLEARVAARTVELQQAAERLADSEERFRLLVQHSSDIITILTPEGTVLYQSPSLEHVLGYAPAERAGKNIYVRTFVHPEDVEAKKAMLRQAVEHPEELVRAEFRLRHKDGRWRWIEAVARNLLHDPRIGGIIANYRDVTERKQAVERLADSEERFRLLVQHSSDIITILAPDGTVRYQSPSLERLLGYAPAEREGQNMFATPLVHPDDAAAAHAMLRQALDQPDALIHAEYRLRHKDGRWRWIEAVARNLLHDPRIGDIIVNSRDITERKDYEQRKDDFISIAAHELRAPLTSVQGFAEVLAWRTAREGRPDLVEIVSKMTQQVSRLTTLVEELLDVSRLQSGNLVFDLHPVALNALVNDIVQEIQPLAPEHRLVIAQTGPVIVRADALKTAQVLRNLLLNAIKYSPDADRVIVRPTHEDSVGCVRIQDFGVGIPVAEQERVFERFGRVQATRDRFPGLGLGLYITKSLVEGQGGTIGVESRPGAGSTFSFTLPLWDEERLLAT